MSLCEQCFNPGRCCRNMHLTTQSDEPVVTWKDEGEQGAIEFMSKLDEPLPFVPIEVLKEWQDETGRAYVEWAWACTKITEAGRCSIYENRPQLCRRFEAASSPLCVFWQPQQEMDAALGAVEPPDIWTDDAFGDIGEWTPPASEPCKDAAD